MQSFVILCIVASGGFVSQAQLNYEGNPLTENTEYTAEESQLPRGNAQRDYQRFEISDGRTISSSTDKFTSWRADRLTTQDEDDPVPYNGRTRSTLLESKQGTNQINSENDGSTSIRGNESAITQEKVISQGELQPSNDKSLRSSNKASSDGSIVSSVPAITAETRQLREYRVPSPETITYQSTSQEEPKNYHQYVARTYDGREQSLDTNKLAHGSQPSSTMTRASGQALSQFLNSRTPEESAMALQNYLAMRENMAVGSDRQSVVNKENINGEVAMANDLTLTNYEQRNAFNNPIERTGYLSSGEEYRQQQSEPQLEQRWNQIGIQSRRDGFHLGVPGTRRPSRYRGPMIGRYRGNPWAQSRLGPGSTNYPHKGPAVFAGVSGPLGPPPAPWKRPIEVIYTRPPGFTSHSPAIPSNPPVPYEDASKWFPDSDQPPEPTKKDIYYSQLYAQSYDPAYYNYIAKTGKIKPWLYGKLGKHESNSIWWELFSGFKKHGMKNMMNPMFLLGMTIPTLTFMLTALVQKRSLGRSLVTNGQYTPEEFIDQYEQQIREALLAYEKRVKEQYEKENNEKEEEEKKSW